MQIHKIIHIFIQICISAVALFIVCSLILSQVDMFLTENAGQCPMIGLYLLNIILISSISLNISLLLFQSLILIYEYYIISIAYFDCCISLSFQ